MENHQLLNIHKFSKMSDGYFSIQCVLVPVLVERRRHYYCSIRVVLSCSRITCCIHMQLAKPVDVVGSREVTPVPEEEESSRWVSPGQVQAELEELSRASRKFLEVS